jgi:phosphatidylglycerophosphate synthase
VTHANHDFERVVILADASANWKIGGLRQLDRLILALNEFAETAGYQHEIAVVIFWEPKIPPTERWLPDNPRFVLIRPMGLAGSLEAGAYLLTTRLFVARNGEFFQTAPAMKIEQPIEPSTEGWRKLWDQWKTIDSDAEEEERGWRVLKQPGDIGPAERQLLQRTGKSQDGFVSRFINRPISRFVTRGLLRFPITPSAWTLSILVLPLMAFFFLGRGDYAGFVIGTALFQIANILDGCDGEIARAKYLESERGRRLDSLCDLTTNLIFVFCLGVGLFRQAGPVGPWRSIYLVESIISCFLIGARLAGYAAELVARDTTRPVSRRDEQSILDSSQHLFGGTLTAFLFQLTKRDVIFFGFFLLAIAGFASWILHLVFIFSVVTLFLRLKDAGAARPR